MISKLSLLACALPLLATDLEAQVLVVSQTGGGDFFDLQVAVSAATDGDTLLIKPGTYGGATLFDKSLTLIGEAGANPTIGRILVQELAAERRVALVGLTLRSATPSLVSMPRLDVVDCAGTVVVQECEIDATPLPIFDAATSGAEIEDSDAVFLIDCAITGGSGASFGAANGRAAVLVQRSTVHVYGGTLRGGDGFTQSGPIAGAGGAGLDLLNGSLILRDTGLAPGLGGSGAPQSGCPVGVDGLPLALNNTPLVDLPGVHRSLSVTPNPIREGQTATVRFEGAPGDAVLWVFGFQSTAAPTPFFGGPILPAALDFVLPQGVLPASGELTRLVPVPLLGAANLTFFEQSLHPASDGTFAVSTPQVVEHLSSGI